MVKSVGNISNMAENMEAMKRNPQAMMKNLQKNIDPAMLNQMGGM